jgi:hypothetical protein
MEPGMEEPASAGADQEPAMDLPLTALVVVPPRPVTIRPGADTAKRPQAGPATSFTQRGVPPAEPTGAPVLAWGGSVAVLALAVVAALVFRAPVMKAWPPSIRLYAVIGLVQP